MRTLIIYDSYFGNTEQIARAIATGLEEQHEVQLLRVGAAQPEQLAGVDLLVVGAPTRAFRPSPPMQEFLAKVPAAALQGVKVAAFDTRILPEDIKSCVGRAALGTLTKLFGYAAKPIGNKLQQKGGELVIEPEGFAVEDSEGPLKAGELDRATEWGRRIAAAS